MTIAPFSLFGNAPTSLTSSGEGSSAGIGGFAAFFTAIMGGVSEIEGSNLEGLINFISGEDVAIDENLGSLLSSFLPEGVDVDLESLTNFSQINDNFPALFGEHAEGKVVYQELVIEIRKTVANLQISGIDISSIAGAEGLAKAYEELGIDPTEAAAKAERIMTAIAMMKERFNIEITGEDRPDLISTIFNMGAVRSDIFQSDLSFTLLNIQVSKTVAAFEASSTLSTGDIGMTILKGEPLQNLIHNPKSDAKLLSVPTADADLIEAEASLKEFKPLTAKDIPPAGIAKQSPELVANSAKIAELSPNIFAGSAEAMAEKERVNVKRTVTKIDTDKVLQNVKSQDLFTVKPQVAGEVNLELRTIEGRVVDLENIDENFDEVIETVTRRTSLESRVEGRSHQAMAKQANLASQVDIQMKSLIKQGGGQIRFRLDPPELGELDIKLNISRGTVRGTIIVQSLEVAEHLARDLRILQQSFNEAGLELHEDGIQFKLKGEDGSEAQQQNAGGSGGQGGEDDDDIINIAQAGEDSAEWVKPDTLLDVSV